VIAASATTWTASHDERAAKTEGGGLSRSFRTTLHQSSFVQLENACIAPAAPDPAGYEPRHQVALTYSGLFAYNVGKRRWLVDANSILFISPGWEFFEQHPVAETGHAALLINPSRQLLDELVGSRRSSAIGPFTHVTAPASMRLRLLMNHMLFLSPHRSEPLHYEEWIAHALAEALHAPGSCRRQSSRVVERAKELLHAASCERLLLDDMAAQVGVTPVYLTQEFTRCEGVPLYRYQMRLRLARSLVELPHCNDITGLALDLGFSSHSHFTCVFREAFGITPSAYRSGVGSPRFAIPSKGASAGARRAA
jgi:AraC-like DNA-binding protein